jgi:CBS domain-containing protein
VSAAAGSGGTPLAAKLGLRAGTRVAFVDAPSDFPALLGALPEGLELRASLRGRLDGAVCFVTSRAVLARRVAVLRRAIAPDGMAWIAWPKRSSGVATDVTDDVVREVALPTGLVDVKVCAIDATWSALKLVVRKELR